MRRIRERQALEMNQRPAGDAIWDAVKEVLDEELDRLPEKYRLPVILFHLEGRSLEEIAALLSTNTATIGTRLSRGRERLRARLHCRGVGLSTAALVAQISLHADAAVLPTTFVAATAHGANLFAVGNVSAAAISTESAALAKGAIHMLAVAKLKLAISALVAGTLVCGATVAAVKVVIPSHVADMVTGAGTKQTWPGLPRPDKAPRAAIAAVADKNVNRDDSEKTTAGAPAAKSTKAISADVSRPSPRRPEPEKTVASDVAFSYAGTVVDDKGQPVAGAQITFGYWRRSVPTGGVPTLAVSDAQGRFRLSRHKSDFSDAGESDDAWEYATLIATKEGYGLADAASIDFETTGKLANERHRRTDGLSEKPSNVLKLVSDDVPVRGRIVDTQGRPVAGATVETIDVWAGADGTFDAWEKAAKEPRADFQRLRRLMRPMTFGERPAGVPTVQTDATGWFTLKGLGRERIADVVVSGPGIETAVLHVRSRRGNVVQVPLDVRIGNVRRPSPSGGLRLERSFYPCEFTSAAGPSVPVEGSLTDSKSKRPLAGIIVRPDRIATNQLEGFRAAQSISTMTDKDGRYRLQGLPLGLNLLGFWPPVGSRYLAGALEVTTRISPKPLVADVQLTAGTLVRGRVTDAATGMPVQGAVDYFAFQTNPFLKEAPSFEQRSKAFQIRVQSQAIPDKSLHSDENGVFEIPVLPGKGIVAFRADRFRAFPFGVGADRIDGPKEERFDGPIFITVPDACAIKRYHLLTPVDPRSDTESLTLALTVDSRAREKGNAGLSVKGRVLAPDGQPLSDYYILQTNRGPRWGRQRGETFEVIGYSPTEHRRLMFYQPEKNLVGSYELTGQPPAELEIKLQPAATIVGRIVDADGQPLEDVEIVDSSGMNFPANRRMGRRPPGAGGPRPAMNVPANRESDARQGILLTFLKGRQIVTDKQGRFELPGIIPGLKYSARGRRFDEGNGPPKPLAGVIFTDVTAKPGEKKQLGDLRLKAPQLKGLEPRTKPNGE